MRLSLAQGILLRCPVYPPKSHILPPRLPWVCLSCPILAWRCAGALTKHAKGVIGVRETGGGGNFVDLQAGGFEQGLDPCQPDTQDFFVDRAL